MKIAFIGAGNMAIGMARLFEKAGHATFLSYSRNADKLRKAAAEIGAGSGTLAEAVEFGDLIVLAVPWQGALEALGAAGDFKGKILWSIVTPFKPDFSGLALGTTTSGNEELAKAAANAGFVAGWPPFAEVLHSGNPKIGSETATAFYCGEEAAAKETVAGLLRHLGCDPVDAGPLRNARLVEPAMFLLVELAYRQKMGPVGYRLLRGG